MAFSMIGPGIQQMTQTMTQQVKQAAAQVGQAASEVRDRVELGGSEPAPWKPFPQTGGMGGAKPAGQQLQTMEQADEAAAAAIDQMVQLSGSRQPGGPVGGGQITNFNTQALDQQLMISDVRAAQAIQRQTQLAGSGKLNNPKTQAALARLGERPFGTFARQAAAQQKGEGKPATQPSPQRLTWM
ncbi:hypothetical protein ABS71_10365 [bacterium SCN 62-11]|nr:MAG: hypothetical protein ABS71_10365 [bacterium SCN 62-11]